MTARPRFNKKQRYAKTSPCENCPFRTDVVPYLTRARAEEIAASLDQGEFPCHKTVRYDDDEDGGRSRDSFPREVHCAGAMIMLEKMGNPSVPMKLAAAFGMYDRTRLNMDAPVFDSAEDFINAQLLGGVR